MAKLVCVLVLVSVILYQTRGSNILGMFNYPSRSHHILGEALLMGLAKRGHNVTMVSPFGASKIAPNYTHIEIEGILRYKEENLQGFFQGQSSVLEIVRHMPAFQRFTPLLLESKKFQDLLRSNSTFDAVIMMVGISDVLLAVGNHFKAPVIGFAPVGGITMTDNLMGNPTPYSYVPNALSPFTDDMSFAQRVLNTLCGLGLTLVQKFQHRGQNKYLTEYFPGSPPVEDLAENISLILINSHISTETPRPYLPNMIQIGGFHIQEPQILPEHLQQFLDSAEKGVIYFSFGTNIKISQLPPDIVGAFVEAFKATPLTVLWKYESDDAPETSANVHLEKWLPQRGVLAHRNVKAFITHGGMGSTSEALYYGVPLVCIPFFGDQEKNCADVVRYGIGKRIGFDELTADLLRQTLGEILNDARYATNVKLRSELYKEQPIKPMDNAVYWVEHVIKHKGAKHLRAQATKLAWYQLLLLDVAVLLTTVLLTTVFTIYYLMKMTLRKLLRKPWKKAKQN